jgi:beta-galactosidase
MRKVMLLVGGLLALWVMSGGVALAAADAREVEEDCSVVSSLVTPHKPWAKGYARGPVRALVFSYTGTYDGSWEDPGTRVREVVELAQRFDVQAEAVLYCGPSGGQWHFHGGKLGEDRAERLLQKPYDLYLLAGFAMDKLPARMQYLILKQVAQGAGLVCCGPGAGEYMVARRKLSPVPAELVAGLPVVDGKQPAELISAYTLGKGRGVWLNYSTGAMAPRYDFSYRARSEYDYWMLWVGRSALWAVGREPEVQVALPASPGQLRLPRTAAPAPVEVELTSRAAQALPVTMDVELRRVGDDFTRKLSVPGATLAAGQAHKLSVSLPKLRAGDYFLDLVVRSRRGVEACAAVGVALESDLGIEKVELGQSFVERGQSLTGKVLLQGAVPAGALLKLAFRDSYDRVQKQQELRLTAGQKEQPFRYQADALATILMRAQATLVQGGEEIALGEGAFTVPNRRQGQMNFVMWDMANDVLGYEAWRQCQRAGYNICLLGSMGGPRKQPPALLAADATLAPYSTRILDPKDEQGFMQPMCWNDDGPAQAHVAKIVDNQKHLREQGVFVYSLGDEGVTLGCCVHPACIEAYRRYLAGQYGTIEKLNASWGTTYKSFAEVDLLDYKDNMETAALKVSYPRWYDRQAFARYNLMQFTKRFVEAYKGLDPEALTGFEGTGNFGDDYDALVGNMPFYGPYPSIGDDIVRSRAPRESVRSNWMGYSKTGDALSDAAWRMVMKGMDSVWYWMWSGIGSWRGYVRPTLDYWPAIEDLTAEMKPVREGLGDLILQSQPAHSGIAVLYTLPSALASKIDGAGQFITAQNAHENLTNLTYDLGLDFRYVTSEMLRRGDLNNREFKALLLPMSNALSPEEAALIRRFAENGGTVIADVRPGIYDGHCKPVAPGLLDDLFGIKRTGNERAVESAVTIRGELGGQAVALALAKAKVDPAVQPAGAVALGQADKTPVVLVNKVGQGQAVLLNLQPVITTLSDPQTESARQLMAAVYRLAKARSAVTATSPAGGALINTETRVWQNGGAQMVGLWRRMENAWFGPKTNTLAGKPVPAQVTFNGPRHVYDLRGGNYLGRVSKVNTQLRWGRASFYLALPYAIPAPKLSLSTTTPRGGETVTAAVKMAVPARSREKLPVWVEVIDPQGHKPLWGGQVVMVQGGEGQAQFKAAFNDAPGQWQVRATELFSRQSAVASWTVK